MPERADKFTFLLVGIIAGIFIEELIGVGTRTLSSVQQGSVGPPLSPSNSICEGLLYQQQQQLTKQADAAAKAAMNAAAAAARQHNEQPCPAAPARAPECPPPPACPLPPPSPPAPPAPQLAPRAGGSAGDDSTGRPCCVPAPRALSMFAPNNFGFENVLQLDPIFMLERLVAMMPGKKRWYVQIGAHASAQAGHNDPTEKFFEKAGWSGLLVEPVPQIHALLDSFVRKSGRPIKTANVAICPSTTAGESLTFYSIHHKVNVTSGKIAGERKVPHWLSQLGSLEKERIMQYKHWVKGNRTIEDLIEEIKVECLTVPSLLQRYNIHPSEVVAMVIDAQGQDSKIVQDLSYDAVTQFRPAFIIYEHVMFRHPERQVTVAHLWKFGYTCWYHNGNTWCIKLGAT